MKQIYLDADRELAELLGWTNIIQRGDTFPWMSGDNPKTGKFELIPSWCSESAAVFQLQLDYHVVVQLYKLEEEAVSQCGIAEYVCARILDDHGDERFSFDADWQVEHESKAFAARYSVVKVIIKLLKKPTE